MKTKKQKTPLFHITKKQNIDIHKKWKARIFTLIISFLLCAIISAFNGVGFGTFFKTLGTYSFGNQRMVILFLYELSILALIAIALVPAFKMKFWNIGAEGQVLMGALMCSTLQKFLSPVMNLNNGGLRFVFLLITILCSIAGGAIFAFIPAFFKARFNTNETLFTLMMNYIAIQIVQIVVYTWDEKGRVPSPAENTFLPKIGGYIEILSILIVAIVSIAIFIYLKYAKHGYEISVVGNSKNTALYTGIKIKKVILRTLLLSGGICGLAGFLLMAGKSGANLTSTVVNGRGFTGVMIAWIGNLNPIEIIFFSLISAFISRGGSNLTSGEKFGNILLSVTFFCLAACEFFINYEIHCEKLEKFNSKMMEKKFPKTVYNIHIKVKKGILFVITKIENCFSKIFDKIISLFKKNDDDDFLNTPTLTKEDK